MLKILLSILFLFDFKIQNSLYIFNDYSVTEFFKRFVFFYIILIVLKQKSQLTHKVYTRYSFRAYLRYVIYERLHNVVTTFVNERCFTSV